MSCGEGRLNWAAVIPLSDASRRRTLPARVHRPRGAGHRSRNTRSGWKREREPRNGAPALGQGPQDRGSQFTRICAIAPVSLLLPSASQRLIKLYEGQTLVESGFDQVEFR
jgi:hypothetical protein